MCAKANMSNSLSILGPQPHSWQNAAHFLGFFSHQIWIHCAEVWAHPILQQVTLPVNSRSSATLNQDQRNKSRKNSFLVANCQCCSSAENKLGGNNAREIIDGLVQWNQKKNTPLCALGFNSFRKCIEGCWTLQWNSIWLLWHNRVASKCCLKAVFMLPLRVAGSQRISEDVFSVGSSRTVLCCLSNILCWSGSCTEHHFLVTAACRNKSR